MIVEPSEIKAILESTLALEELLVKGDGSHFEVIAVGDMFDGMSRVKKQQTIYGPLMEHIRTNAIHALSIKALTPAEWARDKKLMQPL
ncbi:BolA family iron metabolism protein IbaG [Enterovibrio baiacu]|uniref:BolA family iron metabolism protein IbaG n=1 Tax=Enterovibrio baiacu TaxID=2491023 RepID=UPI001892B115|nr:BolA family iron metabolism protein IbaG [Enterovibrio baiacu]